MRKSYFVELEKQDFVEVYSEYNRKHYDSKWLETLTETWIIRNPEDGDEELEEFKQKFEEIDRLEGEGEISPKELQERRRMLWSAREEKELFSTIRKAFNEKLPRKFTFKDGEETFLIDHETDNYGNLFRILTEREASSPLLPHSIEIAYHSNLEFRFARRLDWNKHVIQTLLKECLPDVRFEWQHIPTPEEIEKERIEKQKQLELERLRESLREIDYQIMNLRKQGFSLWHIAHELNVSINTVIWSLHKMWLAGQKLPELLEGWPVQYQPHSRKGRNELRKSDFIILNK